ncbi:MAG: glycosyltransferase [Candidatus Doudnabacteria bacterium]|nr:glycosyltransferase [Candidatus Doudnabacteria bacterium]
MILYFSRNPDYSNNAVYIKGLKRIGQQVIADRMSFWECLRFIYANWKKVKTVVVEPDRPGAVIGFKIFTGKIIVYNALCSVYERLIVSRALAGRFSLKALYYWLVDFFSAHLADTVMLESKQQIKYFCRLFKVAEQKCLLSYTGADQEKFFWDENIIKREKFTVVFRGRFLPESGAEVVVRAAKLLESEDVDFLLLGSGVNLSKVEGLIKELSPKHLRLIADRLPIEQLRQTMQSAHLSLGQLSDHPRLERTIPHKCFESLAVKTAYLTGRGKAVSELLSEGQTCLVCNPGDAKDLAEKIMWAKNHKSELARIAESGFQFFQANLTEEKLAANLLAGLRTKKIVLTSAVF